MRSCSTTTGGCFCGAGSGVPELRRKRRDASAYLLYFIFSAAFCAFLPIEVQPRYAYLPQLFLFTAAARFAANIAVCWLLAYGVPACRGLLKGASETVRGNVSILAGMCLFTGFNYLGQRLLAFRKA